MKRRIISLVAVTLMASPSFAALKLPSIFGDHMVLQRGTAPLWGWAEPGKTITVTLGRQKASAKADADGKWKVSLKKLKAGGPFELKIDGDGSVTLSDVLVGDVWMGSGQSNMEFLLSQERDASTEIPKADYPKIRLFTVDHAADYKPSGDVQGSWKVCSPESAKDFSAVAYYFGRDLQKALKIPVGLIADSWGGTPGEDWVPRDVLDKDPQFADLMKTWDWDKEKSLPWTEGLPYELDLADIRLVPKGGKGQPLTISLEAQGSGVGMWNCQANTGSTATFTSAVKGPKGETGAILSGKLKGGCWITLSTPLKEGSPVIDLTPYESLDFWAKGTGKYYFKFSQSSIADYNYYATDDIDVPSDWKHYSFPLSSFHQGDWGTKVAFTPDSVQQFIINPDVPYLPEAAGVAYNGMIAPLVPFGLKGVLWYQGESNAGRAAQYEKLLTHLITSWREAWGSKFPFLIVQLPNFMARSSQPTDTDWARLREAQMKASEDLKGVGFVTTIDLGEAGNIHPKDKSDVGDRLSRLALAMAYGKKNTYTSPLFVKASVRGKAMILTFRNFGKGLAAKGGGEVTGFALAGPDGSFHWADAKIAGKGTVKVTCPDVAEPREIRYAWGDNPDCNLASKEGFPAAPFRFSFPPKPGDKKPGDDIPPPPAE